MVVRSDIGWECRGLFAELGWELCHSVRFDTPEQAESVHEGACPEA
jgi:hypothetical protein